LQNEIKQQIRTNEIMAAQYQKTSSQIIDLMQQNIIKKHCFLELRT
jgi:hypothetical protein